MKPVNILLAFLFVSFSACARFEAHPTPVVNIDGGQIQGVYEENGKVAVFKGIPYAAPPVGKLRWSPPQPVEPWEGLRDATRYGPICPQEEMDDGEFFTRMIEGQGMGWFREHLFKFAVGLTSKAAQDEDCLYLNVRTTNPGGAAKLPVMVWIHGGGHQSGSGSDDFYQSNSLVQRGVVLVTFNYRLGPLGYFAHPALSAESEHGVSGNYGTLDQIAALKWVRNNIAAFGGDPDNVTIFGESAGGESVAEMMVSPLARGLFNRSIMESASTGELLVHLKRPVLNFKSAEEAGREFAEKAVGPGGSIEALRAMTPAELLAAYRAFPEYKTYLYPIIDGYVLPKSVIGSFLDGDQAAVPLLVGTNADEGSLLYNFGEAPLYGSSPGPKTAEEYGAYMRRALGPDAERALALYPASDDASVFEVCSDVYGDSGFGAMARFYAKQMARVKQPAYLYFFNRVPPSPKQTVGAFHAAEIAFVFDKSVPLFPKTTYDFILRRMMGDYWAQFAKTGNPNTEGLPEWPAFSKTDQRNMLFGPRISAAPVERAEAYDIFERYMVKLVESLPAAKQ